jgi:hypothetical protein
MVYFGCSISIFNIVQIFNLICLFAIMFVWFGFRVGFYFGFSVQYCWLLFCLLCSALLAKRRPCIFIEVSFTMRVQLFASDCSCIPHPVVSAVRTHMDHESKSQSESISESDIRVTVRVRHPSQ